MSESPAMSKRALSWTSASERRRERTRTIVLITRRSQVQILPPPPTERPGQGRFPSREPALSVGRIGPVVNDLSTLVPMSTAAQTRQHAAPRTLLVPHYPRSNRRLRNPTVASGRKPDEARIPGVPGQVQPAFGLAIMGRMFGMALRRGTATRASFWAQSRSERLSLAGVWRSCSTSVVSRGPPPSRLACHARRISCCCGAGKRATG